MCHLSPKQCPQPSRRGSVRATAVHGQIHTLPERHMLPGVLNVTVISECLEHCCDICRRLPVVCCSVAGNLLRYIRRKHSLMSASFRHFLCTAYKLEVYTDSPLREGFSNPGAYKGI
eukprot:285484-Prorocentrum_minimum.AAC.3